MRHSQGGAAVFFMYEYPLKFGGLVGPVKLLALMRPPLRKLEGHFSGLEGWAVARGSTTSARREARLRYGLGRQYEGDTCAQLGLQRHAAWRRRYSRGGAQVRFHQPLAEGFLLSLLAKAGLVRILYWSFPWFSAFLDIIAALLLSILPPPPLPPSIGIYTRLYPYTNTIFCHLPIS